MIGILIQGSNPINKFSSSQLLLKVIYEGQIPINLHIELLEAKGKLKGYDMHMIDMNLWIKFYFLQQSFQGEWAWAFLASYVNKATRFTLKGSESFSTIDSTKLFEYSITPLFQSSKYFLHYIDIYIYTHAHAHDSFRYVIFFQKNHIELDIIVFTYSILLGKCKKHLSLLSTSR